MLVVTAFHPGDAQQALRLAKWIRELDGCLGHNLLLVADTAVQKSTVDEITAEFQASFDHVQLLPFVDHYRGGKKWADGGSPASANDMFATAAKNVAWSKYDGPWLFLEPDCCPLKPGWLDEIAAEYAALPPGRRFLGELVTAQNSGKDVVDHCSGVAVYPNNLFEHAGDTLIAGSLAFDVAGAGQIVPQMQTSELILHHWRSPAFESWAQVEDRIFAKKPKCVLFHADKSDSLIQILRARKAGDLSCQSAHATAASEIAGAHATANEKCSTTSNAAPTFEPERAATKTFTLPDLSKELSGQLVIHKEPQIPWQSRPDTVAEIQRLAERLKQFGDNSSHVREVRELLHKTGVIVLTYRNRKRKGWKKRKKK